jgi:hypothetical protein
VQKSGRKVGSQNLKSREEITDEHGSSKALGPFCNVPPLQKHQQQQQSLGYPDVNNQMAAVDMDSMLILHGSLPLCICGTHNHHNLSPDVGTHDHLAPCWRWHWRFDFQRCI